MAKTTMTLSKRGAIESVCNEAIVLSPYLDSKRILTLGIGHTANAGPPDPATFKGELTIKEAFELFMDVDAPKYAERVNRAVKVALAQHEFDALFDFDFNTGAIFAATLTKSLNLGNRELAAKQFMNYKKPPEIIERRKRSMELFQTGKYHQRYAMLYPVTAKRTPNWSKGRRIDLLSMLDGKTMVIMPPSALPAKVVAGSPNYITTGAKGAETRKWQETLVALGYNLKVDGDFGKTTLARTKEFQRKNGLLVDGRVGKGTRDRAAALLAEQRAAATEVTPAPVVTPKPDPVEVESDAGQNVAATETDSQEPEVVANSPAQTDSSATAEQSTPQPAKPSTFWELLLGLFFPRR